jgi:tetratricopeptide (TPR) repeat protein
MPLLVVAAAWLAQGAVLGNGWVWDDAVVVRDDPDLARGVAAIPRLVSRNWYGETDDVGLWRPLVSATLAVDASVFGTDDPFGFHLTNLFLHGLVCVALLAVLHRLLPGRPVVAAAGALLFAVHPLHTGTVSWIVARGDLLAALFSCLAALVFLRPGAPTLGRTLATAALVFLALCGKEMAAPLPAALVLLDAGGRGEGLPRALARRGWAYLLLLVPLAAWFALRSTVSPTLGAAPGMQALADRERGERLVVGLHGLARTAWSLAVPAGLSGDRSDDPLYEPGSEIPSAHVWVAMAVLALTAVAVARHALRRGGVLSAAWVLFVVLSAPVLQVVPLGAIHEDRFAYVPSLAFVAVLGVAAEALVAARPRALGVAACASAVVAFAAASVVAARDWRDDRAFNEALLERQPAHRMALHRLARWHLDEARVALAIAASRPVAAGEDVPERREAREHLAEAQRIAERALSIPSRRHSAPIWRTLADARLQSDQAAAAAVAYETALEKKRVRLDGRSVPYQAVTDPEQVGRVAEADARFMGDTWYRLGVARLATGDEEKALGAFRQAALWRPDVVEYQQRAGAEYLKAGMPREALPFLARAAEIAVGRDAAEARRVYRDTQSLVRKTADDWFERGVEALRRVDGQEDALDAFEAATVARPNFVRARIEAAKLQGDWKGNLRAAIEHLHRARQTIEASPDDPEAQALRDEVERLRAKYEAEFGD